MDKVYKIYGLTPKQTRLYIAGLKIGPAPLQKIADEAKLGRTNAYDAIHALISKGLVSLSSVGKRKIFVTQPPKALHTLLREQETELNELIPQLEAFNAQTEFKPKIMFYPGIEGYKKVYEDSLTSKEKKLFGIFSVQDIWEVLGREYADDMVARRAKKGIALRVIRSKIREHDSPYPSRLADLRELRFAPAGMDFPVTTYVYDNKVIILSSKREMFGLIIESDDIAQAHRHYFEALWQISTPDR